MSSREDDSHTELQRLEALASFNIVDSGAEPVFDSITALAATVCDAPLSFISFVAKDRQWFKSARGLGVLKESERSISFCHHAIMNAELFEVEDALLDDRFCDSPFVTGEPNIRFYAGMPLTTASGENVGTVCVADTTSRRLSVVQRQALRDLAGVVMRLLELRMAEGQAVRLGEMLDRSCNEVFIFDAKTMLVEYASIGAENNSGFSLAQMRDQAPAIFGSESNGLKLRSAVKPLLAGERDKKILQLNIGRRDGGSYPALVQLQVFLYQGRKVIMATVNDITQQKEDERYMRIQQTAMEGAIDGMAILDARGRYVYLNNAHVALFGYSNSSELLGRTWRTLYEAEEASRIEKDVFKLLESDGKWEGETKGRRRDGTTFEQGVSLALLGGGIIVCVCRDISVQKAAEEALFREKELAQVTLKSIGDAVITTDTIGTVTYLNPVAESMTGWSTTDASGERLADVFHVIEAESRKPTRNPMTVALAQNRTVGLAMDCLLVDRSGMERAIEDSAAPIHDRAGDVVGGVLVFRDISETRAMALHMAHLAQHDPLTNLPNRTLLMDRVLQATMAARRGAHRIALLYLDLDDFKQINDSLGHEAGDRVLLEIADRLQSCVRATDTVSRQGGDEFVILLSEIETSQDVALVANKLLTACARAVPAERQQVFVGASIGIAVFPEDGNDIEALMRNADAAMYHAKESGRNNFQFYAPAMNMRAKNHLKLKSDLRRAIADDQFELFFQPKIDLTSRRIVGAEALVRWRHPEQGLVLPGEFIEFVEKNGMMLPIGEWVIHAACRQMARWRELALPSVPVAVNVSAAQFRSGNVYEQVSGALEENNVRPELLEIELTESTIMRDTEAVAKTLGKLKQSGIRISIDDFGTGYSSLGQLWRFPIDTLKIDRSFIENLSAESDELAITTAVVTMANQLRLEVVAEGVETADQVQILQQLGCNTAQGHYFYQALRAVPFINVLREQDSDRNAVDDSRQSAD